MAAVLIVKRKLPSKVNKRFIDLAAWYSAGSRVRQAAGTDYRDPSRIRRNRPPWDPTVGLCLELYGGPMGVAVSYERGTPVVSRDGPCTSHHPCQPLVNPLQQGAWEGCPTHGEGLHVGGSLAHRWPRRTATVLSHRKCLQSHFAQVHSRTNPSTHSLC